MMANRARPWAQGLTDDRSRGCYVIWYLDPEPAHVARPRRRPGGHGAWTNPVRADARSPGLRRIPNRTLDLNQY